MNLTSQRTGIADYLRGHPHPGSIIVSEQNRFIYMKPPKTAGTSILRAGLEKLPQLDLFHFKDHPQRFADWLDRMTDEQLQDYFIFSVSRNPWDRLVSVATYFNQPFKAFVDNIETYFENPAVRTHALPISQYTHLNGNPFVDFVCRFECLQAEMNLVFDRIGVPRQRLAFVNRSNHGHYSRYYDDRLIEKVAEIYPQDIQYFGYMFERPPGRAAPSVRSLARTILSRLGRRSL